MRNFVTDFLGVSFRVLYATDIFIFVFLGVRCLCLLGAAILVSAPASGWATGFGEWSFLLVMTNGVSLLT